MLYISKLPKLEFIHKVQDKIQFNFKSHDTGPQSFRRINACVINNFYTWFQF